MSSSKPLPAGIPSTPFAVTVSGTFVVDNLTATTDVYLTIKVSGTTKLTYNASVTGFNNTDVGVGSVSYVPAKTPTGPLANITFQVRHVSLRLLPNKRGTRQPLLFSNPIMICW